VRGVNSTTNLNPILPLLPLRGSPVVQVPTNGWRHIMMIQNIAKLFSTVHLNDPAMVSINTLRSPTTPIILPLLPLRGSPVVQVPNKRLAAHYDDPEYRQALLNHSSK